MSFNDSRQRRVMLIIMVSYLMLLLDVSIVITGLPKIQQTMHASTTALSWVQNAYTLFFGGLLLLGARMGDLLGRRRMFIVGLGLFTVASVAIGASPSMGWLIAARAIQGIGAAVLAPSTLALLTTEFEEGPQRTRAVGYYAATAGVGASLGLVIGGLLADWFSWRVGFFINLPIGIALIAGARRYLTETEKHSGQFDIVGAVTSTLGMGALVFGLVHAADHGGMQPMSLGAVAFGLCLLGALVWNESRASQPIMPVRLFENRQRNSAYLSRVLFLGGMVGFWFFGTQLLQGVLGFRPALAGLAFLPATIPNFLAALAVPRLTQRFGNTAVLIAGLVFSVVGMAWLSRAQAGDSFWISVALPMVLIGTGQGGTLGPLTVAAMKGVNDRDAGAASGLVNAAHQLGGSIGLSILVVLFAAAPIHASQLGSVQAVLAERIQFALTGSAIFLAGACLAAIGTTSRRLTATV